MVPRKRTRVWLWPALSALVLAGLVVVFMPRREEHALMPAPVAKPAAAVGAPVNAPAGPAPAPDAPAQPAEPIRIRAEPSGAHFFAGDMLLGDTEARVARPAQGQVRVAVRRAGYFPKEVVIENASPELITVILEAEAARKPEAKLSPSKPHDKPEAKRGAPRRAPSGLSDVVDPWR